WAGRSMVEIGLDAACDALSARLPGLLAAVADAALALLERAPAEPLLLRHAGVALHGLNSLDAAHAMLAAARRLDPRLTGLEDDLAAVGTQRASIGAVREESSGAAPSTPSNDLAARAVAVAGRAQPVEGLRLSVCMIVRDEEEMLPRCLAAVADAVEEIVVVDTGSSDATVEIARSFGARVLTRPWSGSFAEARNASFDAASGDWLLFLDADEVLVSDDVALLRSLVGRTWREAFSLTEINHTGELRDGTAVTHEALRVVRNRPEYRFQGRVHEQIAPRLPGYLPERFEASGVRIEHYGYLAAVRQSRGKSERNIELLRMEQAEGRSTPFLHYNLGSEYAAGGDTVAALAEFERSWALLADVADLDRHEFAPALVSRTVKALRACNLHADAITRAEEGLERFPGFTDLVFEQALASAALGRLDGAIELLERCIEMGDAPPRYAATAGCGSHLARVELELYSAWRRLAATGGSATALSAATVGPLTAMLETLLRAHDFEAFETLLGLLASTPLPPRERRELLAEMYLRHGFASSAAEDWMAVCAEQPDVRALLGLARVAAAQGMWREASDFAAAALAEDPHDETAAALLSQARAEVA
ncbi:MAG TPA: glycosyltransferase, partial [Solirubrobacteraceae bacterium]|nr:glycosyltransferase [Solirubrobacteraceae bacterium]